MVIVNVLAFLWDNVHPCVYGGLSAVMESDMSESPCTSGAVLEGVQVCE